MNLYSPFGDFKLKLWIKQSQIIKTSNTHEFKHFWLKSAIWCLKGVCKSYNFVCKSLLIGVFLLELWDNNVG
jgi:hypothetical protein